MTAAPEVVEKKKRRFSLKSKPSKEEKEQVAKEPVAQKPTKRFSLFKRNSTSKAAAPTAAPVEAAAAPTAAPIEAAASTVTPVEATARTAPPDETLLSESVEAVVRAARREGEGGGEALIESLCHLLSYSHHGCEGQQGRAVMAMAARAGASLLGWRGLE